MFTSDGASRKATLDKIKVRVYGTPDTKPKPEQNDNRHTNGGIMSLSSSILSALIKTYVFVPVPPSKRRKDRCHRQNGTRRPTTILENRNRRSGDAPHSTNDVFKGPKQRTPNLGALSSTNRDGVTLCDA
jgi:hypothetical protein